ncbi:hypothetical protein BST61_g2767 [Cercospora zeina]
MVEQDLAYLLELLMVDVETEDELDERLKADAKELGLDIAVEYVAEIKQQPFRTYCSDDSRRSESIDSRTSHSTGPVSTFSEVSKDYTSHELHPRHCRASLSFRDYDSFVSRGVPDGPKSSFFSPASPTRRSLFLPLSQPASPDLSPRRHLRKLRGISLLRRNRPTSLSLGESRCPHCPEDPPNQRRAIHRLTCGHRLCTQALRNTIKAAIDSDTGAVPSCCGRPVPGSLVERVMTQEEQNALLEKLEQWDDALSMSTSMSSSRRNSSHTAAAIRCVNHDSHTLSDDASIAPLSVESQHHIHQALAREDYKLLHIGQTEQRDRLLRWALKQSEELLVKHEQLRQVMLSTHEADFEEMQEQHALATSDAEDKQVKAESELREVHEKERRDNATALKHMEAYCAGTYSNGEAHDRTVTDQDFAELEKTRWYRDSMNVRHENAINVLRGEQSRRLRLRASRQDRALQDLKRQQRKAELELERSCNGELAKLNDTFEQKRRKIRWRWELQMAILAKKIEAEIGNQLDCRLPTADWQSDSIKPNLACLSTPKSLDAGDSFHMLERHDSTTTETGLVLHDPDTKVHHLPALIMQEFKIGVCRVLDMANYDCLVTEVDRITSSPYPSQLRTLYRIAEKCSDADIAQWAAANPCLIETLASCLLEGLQQWTYVLDIITKFSFNAACRDALLRQEPTLLHSAVARAIKCAQDNSKYVRASVALLSLPLPETVALPAEAQTLFIQLVEEAAKRPCPATIQPIYLILSGTRGLLPGVLSSETMSRLEDHLLEILKNSSSTPDGCLSLYCLSIMHLVCASTDPEFRLTASSYNTQDFLASTPVCSRWKSEAMQQFFTGTKAQRSIQLVVLSAYLAAKATASDCTPEKVNALVLANEIIAAIPLDIRKIWTMANTGMVRKLQERLCAEDIERSIRTLALRFVGKLCELDTLPHPVLKSLELTFLEPEQLHQAHILCPHIDDSALFSGVLARAPIRILLDNAIEYATRMDSAALAAGADAITQAIASSEVIVSSQKITSHQIKEILRDENCLLKLEHLRDLLHEGEPGSGGRQAGGWCSSALRRARSRLAQQICNLLLRASPDVSFGSYAMTVLLSLHALSARGDVDCMHSRRDEREVLSLEGLDLSDCADEQFDWREALHTHFKARANVEQDAATRLFAKACANLEARCENVEKPLREERERARVLEEHNSALTSAFEEIEAKYVDTLSQIRSLEEEEHLQADELHDALKQNAELFERVSSLEERLCRSQAEAQQQLGEMKTAKQVAELDAAARVASKQEALEDAEDETAKWKSKYNELVAKVSTFELGLDEAEAEREQLQERLSSSDRRVSELEREVSGMKAELDSSMAMNNSLEEQLRSANSDGAEKFHLLSELREELRLCQTERDDVRAELDRETSNLHAIIEQKERERNGLAQESKTARDSLQQQLTDAQQEITDITASRTNEIETRDTRISDFKKRIEEYQRKCQEKDQQIADAESMRANLMAAMGIHKSQSRGSLPHRSRESFAPQTQTQPDDFSHVSGEDMGLSVSNLDESSIWNRDSSQEDKSGPTPKRQKPRKSLSFAAPLTTTAKPRASVGGRGLTRASTGVRQSAGRQPLAGVNGNRASLKPFKTPRTTKEAAVDAAATEDESTFEGSELFTGTQGGQMLDFARGF